MWKHQVFATVVLVGVTAVAMAQLGTPHIEIRQEEDGRTTRVDTRPHYEYMVVDPPSRAGVHASTLAEESLNRFTSEGWEVLQVNWSESLTRTVIVFRRMKTPPTDRPADGQRE